MRATYDYGMGPQGNVGANSINAGPALPAFLKVANPVRTWGGAAPEAVAQGEKQIAAYLRHRDRLVTADDFQTIVARTPGVDIGRVEVLAAYNPSLAGDEPGGAPGAVTLMVVPRTDPTQPDAPRPDPLFLDAICKYIDPRRLITTEVFLRGPDYKPIWVSIGIKPVGGVSVPQVREAVKQELLDFLAPLDRDRPATDDVRRFVAWPLRKSVVDRELMAVASRVSGVRLVTNVIVAEGDKPPASEIEMDGLQLPRVLGISVVDGDPVDIGQLRGTQTTPADRPPTSFVPVPIIPEEC
jgi:predicted phage baseplate assembly protein